MVELAEATQLASAPCLATAAPWVWPPPVTASEAVRSTDPRT